MKLSGEGAGSHMQGHMDHGRTLKSVDSKADVRRTPTREVGDATTEQ